jgi:YggT family protein
MSELQRNNTSAIDRHEQTVITQQPGYVTTEQTVHDLAAERRMQTYQIIRLIWGVLALLEIMLGLRFLLKLIGGSGVSAFGALVYGTTDFFVAPFVGLLSYWTAGDMILEVTTLVAMGIYALVFWGFVRVMGMVMERTGTRTFTRSTRQQTPGGPGNERTTRTTTNG